MILTEAALAGLLSRVFERHGMSPRNAALVAAVVAAAERDGAASHGLLRMEGYVATLKSGWVTTGPKARRFEVYGFAFHARKPGAAK